MYLCWKQEIEKTHAMLEFRLEYLIYKVYQLHDFRVQLVLLFEDYVYSECNQKK